MNPTWTTLLVGSLALNAALGFAYRVYRLTRGGPMADVWGQAVLGAVLTALAIAAAAGTGWVRWVALGYAIVFAVVVMPVWVLAVLLPMRPQAVDYGFTAVYWGLLILIGVAAIAA